MVSGVAVAGGESSGAGQGAPPAKKKVLDNIML
jgi:hypothetical protein